MSDFEAEVLKDGFYFGNYLNKGFTIKVEEISKEQLEDVTRFLQKKIPHFNIIYYQLDSKFVLDRKF
jgi:TfoX/Sxy family transcriptional regulator of competence genes